MFESPEFRVVRRSLFLIWAAFAAPAMLHAGGVLAFERNGFIYQARPDGTDQKKLAAGVFPDLSPNGRRLVFNTETPGSVDRYIVVRDFQRRNEMVLKDLPSSNCYRPVWSPDGGMIAYQILINDRWEVAISEPNGTALRTIAGPKGGADLWLGSWAPDGKSVYCYDSNTIYQMRDRGGILRKWSVRKIIPGGSLDSFSALSMSSSGQTLLIGAGMDEEIGRKDLDMPPAAIWSLNVASGVATRLSPVGVLEWGPVWIGNTEFLCSGEGRKSPIPAVYKVSADGKKRELLLENCHSPSIAPR